MAKNKPTLPASRTSLKTKKGDNNGNSIEKKLNTTKTANKENGKMVASSSKTANTKGGVSKSAAEATKSSVPKLGTLKSPLRIFQIYYAPWQKDLLDPSYAAIDNSDLKSDLAEFLILDKLSKSEYVKDAKLWGALSWRFTERTGMTSADWVKAIENNRGKDVYYCDPLPINEALFHNVWLQGETTHPNFLVITQAFFKAAGLPEDHLIKIAPTEEFAAANYFVGSPKFWALYIPWINNTLAIANKKMPPKLRDMMHSKIMEGPHKGMTYVPFILERLFSVFMKTAGKNLTHFKISLPAVENQLNVHLKLLREVKNLSHNTKSAWMAAVWVNYRNLYFMQTNGKDWCAKYLRRITPTDVTFL